jgi:hypothetical protein
MEQPITIDSMMSDFVCDMTIADNEISDSIWTCVDNFIDDLCLRVMDNENSVFETDSSDDNLPFSYIIDKVLEKVDNIDDIADSEYAKSLTNNFGETENTSDPDYCEEVLFNEITPEDFQLYIPNSNIDGESDDERVTWGKDGGTNMTSTYDAIFNA